MWLLDRSGAASAVPAAPASAGFEHAALFVLRSDDMHLTVPCGAVGTRGLGNHSHNDVFSLCLEARGVEWIADPGTGVYTSDPGVRNHFRGTAAHATLGLGAREQNVLPSGLDGLFRMDERARPKVLEWRVEEGETFLRAAHEGFSGDDGVWVHERSVRFRPHRRSFAVLDRLERTRGTAEPVEPVWIRFPLGEGVSARVVEDRSAWPDALVAALREMAGEIVDATATAVRLDAEGARAELWLGLALPGGSEVSIATSVRSPRYGVVEDAPVVVARIPPAALVRAGSVLVSPAPSGPA
jgi:hypothetical protein